MKTMGFDDLVLVRPRWAKWRCGVKKPFSAPVGRWTCWPRHALSIAWTRHWTASATCVPTAMTPRDFGPPASTPREHFAALVQSWQKQELQAHADKGLEFDPNENLTLAGGPGECGVGLLFGC